MCTERQETNIINDEKGLPEEVFDCCFLGAEGEEETVVTQVAKDRRTRTIFAHMVPKEGASSELMPRLRTSRNGATRR